MNGLELNWQNVVDGNGIGISIVGVLAVFIGLFMISMFIRTLPGALRFTDKVFDKLGIQHAGHGHAPVAKPKANPKRTAASRTGAETESPDDGLIAAIAYVIAAETELEAMSDYTKLTIRRDESQQVWGVAGRMRTLATRKFTNN